MSFMLRHFVPNAVDVLRTGAPPLQPDLIAAEFRSNHRVSERSFIAELLPKESVGAEIGVFTGLFSVSLLKYTRSKRIFFVDPWWKEFGPYYPDWGVYTNHGRLATHAAHDIAVRRIARHASSTATKVLVQHSSDFLKMISPAVLDWAYLDSTHSYEGTRAELRLLWEKLKPNGIVAGDDWHDGDHPHAGVRQAVLESVARDEFSLLENSSAMQWMVRRLG